jgi:hypothetical protein
MQGMAEKMEHHMSRQLAVVTVCLEDQADGGLLVYSDMLPGLILAGRNREGICQAIGPAIQAIFERKGYRIAGVYADQPIPSVMRKASPRTVNMNVHMEQFVVEVLEAA